MVIKLKDQNKVITHPKEAWELFKAALLLEDKIDQEKEHFYVLHLDTRNGFKLLELVSIGTINSAIVHPREVFRRAISVGAVQIMIAHNHPTGCLDPSEDDLMLTRKLVEAGKIIGIQVLDHLVFSPQGYLSFKAKDLI